MVSLCDEVAPAVSQTVVLQIHTALWHGDLPTRRAERRRDIEMHRGGGWGRGGGSAGGLGVVSSLLSSLVSSLAVAICMLKTKE